MNNNNKQVASKPVTVMDSDPDLDDVADLCKCLAVGDLDKNRQSAFLC